MAGSNLRSHGLAAVFGAGAVAVLLALHLHYPIGDWLLWRYLGYLGLSGVWVAACLALGLRLFDGFRLTGVAAGERWVMGLALGVLAFGLSMLLLGFPKLWSGWTFVLVPAAFLTIGWRPLVEALSALGSWLRGSAGRGPGEPSSPRLLTLAVIAAGVVGVGLIVVPILNPVNIGYDSRWYHLAIAEQYAVRGGIEAFPERWVMGCQPQLASALYGWAFLLPGGTLFDRLELSMFLELALFLATLGSVPALARALVGRPQPYAWVFLLLFPGLYLYDSNLIGAADHVAAFWAVPIALACHLAWRSFSVRSVVLAATLASAVLLTKYTAVGLVLGPALLLLGRAVYLFVRAPAGEASPSRRSVVVAVGAAVATVLVVTTPHWLKNLVFYGNPVFPLFNEFFDPEGFEAVADRLSSVWKPSRWGAERSLRGVLESLAAPFTFAFVPHDWLRFHGRVPVFGLLYTLTMPAVFFIPKRRRILVLYLVTSIAIMLWYWTYHQDRYLQAYLPWMAACVAAVASQAWRLGRPVRAALVVLIAAQLVVGAGVPFLPTHAMVHGSPFVTSVGLFGGWRSPNRVDLASPLGGFSILGRELPEAARVLIHDQHLTLGIDRPAVTDAILWQTGIDYAEHTRPSQMWALVRSLDVSHVVWAGFGGWGRRAALAEEVAFYYFALNHLTRVETKSGLLVGAVRAQAPADDRRHGLVAILGCGTSYDNGVYRLDSLTASALRGPLEKSALPAPATRILRTTPPREIQALLRGVDAVRVETRCFPELKSLEFMGFVQAHEDSGLVLHVRDLDGQWRTREARIIGAPGHE